MNRIKGKLLELEAMARTVLHDEEREREAARQKRWDDAFETLWGMIPEELHEAFARHVHAGEFSEGSALCQIMVRIWNGSLKKPVPMPAAVVRVFLDDPKAEPYRHCVDCGLMLPYRRGYWVKGNGFWQGGLHYGFKHCPACGGSVEGGYCEDFLPDFPEPPWSFYDELPDELRRAKHEK